MEHIRDFPLLTGKDCPCILSLFSSSPTITAPNIGSILKLAEIVCNIFLDWYKTISRSLKTLQENCVDIGRKTRKNWKSRKWISLVLCFYLLIYFSYCWIMRLGWVKKIVRRSTTPLGINGLYFPSYKNKFECRMIKSIFMRYAELSIGSFLVYNDAMQELSSWIPIFTVLLSFAWMVPSKAICHREGQQNSSKA